jgi:hypothetical protein
LYDDDLSEVVQNVHRSNAEATRRLANHPLTRAFLEAGLRILEREFSATPGPHEERFLRPLATLTRETVIAEVANGPAELPRQGTVGAFRDRWAYFPDYVSDLARYTLRVQRMPWDTVLAEEAGTMLALGDFAAGVHNIAYRRMWLAMRSTALRFRYSAIALAAQDKKLYEAMSSVYEDVTGIWERLFESVLAARGLALRPGVTARDLAILLTALNDGLALRLTSAPDDTILNENDQHGLLGVAALALFTGCVDTGDGESLDDRANWTAAQRR